MSTTIENKEEITMAEDMAKTAESKEVKSEAVKGGKKIGKKKANKNFIEKFEEIAFGNIAGKLQLVSKILLYIFIGIAFAGVVLTMLLTSSLGGLGVIVALLIVGIFLFVGYGISALIYAYGKVVENSAKPNVDFDQIVLHDSVLNQTTNVEKVDIDIDTDEAFPEF